MKSFKGCHQIDMFTTRTVVDDAGTIRQCTMYYPSGLPVQLFGTERVSDRAHIGNRWSNFAGLGWHDNIARWHGAILDRFTTPDPKAADYPSFSPYTHCAANPLRLTDPTGCDTVMVNYADGKWVIDNTQLAEGNDVFIVNIDGKEQLAITLTLPNFQIRPRKPPRISSLSGVCLSR